MSEERNGAIVRSWLEDVWGKGRFELQDELIAPDVVDHNLMSGFPPGLEGQKQMVATYRAAFDIDLRIDVLLATGDYVVCRNFNRMTQKASFMGIPPVDKELIVTGIDICRLEGGKIVEMWHEESIAGLLMQLGVISGFATA